MACYLVTGGAGFIGSAISRHLLKEGHHVIIIDNLSSGYKENIPKEAEFFEVNCQDIDIYTSIPQRKYEAIYHIAGQSSGEISFDDPVYDLQTNTQSTLLLLKFAQKTGCKRLLYASSMSVYGDQPDEATNEEAFCFPKSFYGVGKLASEHYLRIFQQYGIESTALRLFNVYGPGQNMKNLRQGMVSIFLAQALKTKKVIVKGSPDRFRDFVYIEDVVNAFIKCEKEPKSFGKIYNVASSRKTTIRQLLEKMISKLPFEATIEYRGNTPGDQFGIYANIQLIREDIGWKPNYSLEKGIDEMIKWALKRMS